jgi:hypothetical protein
VAAVPGSGVTVRPRLLLVGALAWCVSCEHAQPFGAADLGPNVPFSTAFPRQLTFSVGGDLAPAWLPDGSGIIYSFQRYDRADRDRCLGILPAEGGQVVQTICHRPTFDLDSTNSLWSPAVGPGGVLAYVRESSVPGGPAPSSRELVVASLGNPDPGRVVRTLPYTAPDGQLHATATHLCWVDAQTLVYVAEQVLYTFPPMATDTILTPIEAVRISLAGDSVTLSVLPGTTNASSVTADSAGTIYYTILGDSRIFRFNSAGGAPAVAYDFGGLGAPTDVQVRGTVVVAVVGGQLYRADLAAGTALRIPGPGLLRLRRPALSPSRSGIAVEAAAASRGQADLWLLQAP